MADEERDDYAVLAAREWLLSQVDRIGFVASEDVDQLAAIIRKYASEEMSKREYCRDDDTDDNTGGPYAINRHW